MPPEKSACNVFNAWRVHGPLDVDALEWAFNAVIRTHDSLRTFTLKVERVDLPDALRQVNERAHAPFDPGQPLLRASVHRVTAGEHLLLICMHHSIGDAWSLGLLLNQVGALYDARIAGTVPDLPRPPMQHEGQQGAFELELAYPSSR